MNCLTLEAHVPAAKGESIRDLCEELSNGEYVNYLLLACCRVARSLAETLKLQSSCSACSNAFETREFKPFFRFHHKLFREAAESSKYKQLLFQNYAIIQAI